MAARQALLGGSPKRRSKAKTSGITICVTPPPRLPQPAAVAFAVPTTFGANMAPVWYCVTTKEAPTAPMASRKIKNDR